MQPSRIVSLTLLGILKSWKNYQDLVNGRDKLPNLERFWSDLVQEEIRRSIRDGVTSKTEEEDNFSLASKVLSPKIGHLTIYN